MHRFELDEIRNIVTGPPANFSFVDDYASGSALPVSEREVVWVKKNGITAILSLTEMPLNSEWVADVEYLNVPMRDHAIPTIGQLTRAVRFVLDQAMAKNKVLVHCLAGIGRTGTVLAAYLCQMYKVTPDDSIAMLRSKRPGSVETKQVAVLGDYYRSILNHA